jgi:3-oxoacyl-[acyl-carrier protein] reductase
MFTKSQASSTEQRSSSKRLQNKRYFIQGSSSGMGLAVAAALASHGADLILSARNLEKLKVSKQKCLALGAGIVDIVSLDLEDPDIGKQSSTFLGNKKLSGLLLNGGGPMGGSPSSLTESDMVRAHRLLLLGPVLMLNALLPNLEHASVIAITSTTVREFNPALPLSCAYRSGLVALLKCYSHELGPKGIRFNNIAPGYIDTDKLGELRSYVATASKVSQDQVQLDWESKSVLNRIGTAEEVAKLALFLFSEQSSFITGQTLFIDGGKTLGY